jgi:HlyD family secretion protein
VPLGTPLIAIRRSLAPAVRPKATAFALWTALAFGLGACGNDGGTEIPTATVDQGPFLVELAVPGELEAVDSVTISAPDLGRTIKITTIAEEGSRVKEGDVLVEFDSNELLDDLEQAESKLDVAHTKIEQKKVQLTVRMSDLKNNVTKAELALKRAQMRVTESETVPMVERKSAQINVEEASLNLESSRSTLITEQLKAEAELQLLRLESQQETLRVERVRQRLAKATVTAPSDGLVILPEIWKGGSRGKVQAGDTVWRGSTIMQLPDLSEMQVVAWVHEVDAGRVAVEQPVSIVIDAHPDPAWDAKISKVADLAVKRPGNEHVKHVRIVAELPERGDVMKPGMTVRAEILLEQVEDALSIPQEAVFSDDDGTFVHRKGLRGWTRAPVELGTHNDTHVVVTSGVDAGDVVALTDPDEHEAGEAMSAAKTAPPSGS